jgi:flagellar biosynthesis/type III secretory pathway M-ring protein FliF/YscJ
MFSLIDSLSFSKKDENNTGVKPSNKNKFKNPSLDTAFLVLITLIALFIYGFSIIRKRYRNHYRKKYTGVELREIQSTAPMAHSMKQIY